jgi:hypothetical protein
MSNEPEPAKVRPTKSSWKRKFFLWLIILMVTPVVLFWLYLWIALSWSYSTGERAGYVQKFSRKGYVFKTWEGELAMVSIPGTTPEKFYFSVRADSVADRINQAMGRKVALSYEQHIGLPVVWFGETEYFITNVKQLE